MNEMPPRARKEALSRGQKAMRFVRSVADPRAWVHLLKLVNYYNYTHVRPMREMAIGLSPNISPDASFTHPERIMIGNRARIGSRCHIWPGPAGGKIVIGDDVLFGPEVMLSAGTYDYNAGHPVSDQPMIEGDIVIGNDVWLATRAVVLPGTHIGDGAVIAAGAVVKGNVPPFAIMAGAPAKVVGMRNVRPAE
ncbi:acyltransferase [Aurantiacibacter marinus]|uniref:Transferase n=1 Tax=Aurantiacibacter marinus TaxID=874156 RepID=A0A0H0XQL0_9SPHN|nr:acyltransferase [Aurantiacibacter marinus]KLI64639.1 transferase [Aurantiacibacter marinus]